MGERRCAFLFGALRGIVKSTDAAASWKPANTGRTFIDIRVLAPDPVNADTIYTVVGIDGVFQERR